MKYIFSYNLTTSQPAPYENLVKGKIKGFLTLKNHPDEKVNGATAIHFHTKDKRTIELLNNLEINNISVYVERIVIASPEDIEYLISSKGSEVPQFSLRRLGNKIHSHKKYI